MDTKIRKILVGKKAICDYLDFSEPTFKKFLEMGMPAKIIDRRYYAHVENLEYYFKIITRLDDEISGNEGHKKTSQAI